MGLTLRCRRYIFLAGGLHLELLHGLLGLGNVDPIVVAAHLDSLLTFFFGKDTGFAGKSAFSFRNHSFSRIENEIQVKVRKALQILTDFLQEAGRKWGGAVPGKRKSRAIVQMID